MKQRSIGMMILLTLVTFGVYMIIWTVLFQSELKRKTNLGFGGLGHLILIFVTFGIYYIYWNYKAGERIEKTGGPNNGILYLILVLIGFGWLNPFLMQSEVNKIQPKVIEATT